MMTNLRPTFLALFILLATALYFNGGFSYFSLNNLKLHITEIKTFQTSNPLQSATIYSLLYIALTSLSIPGATILTLAGGALFGFFWGSILVSFASSIGASLAFLTARYLGKDFIQNTFPTQISIINKGIEKDGAYYLFSLRLVPLFPFFMINILMGLTNIPLKTFYMTSQIGMLAGTLVYVNAGTQLAAISDLKDILSPALIGSFALIGILPFIAKKFVEYFPHE